MVKMAKTSHLCFLLDTPTPRRRCARLGQAIVPVLFFSSVNSRIHYSFVWISNGRYLGIIGLIEDPNK